MPLFKTEVFFLPTVTYTTHSYTIYAPFHQDDNRFSVFLQNRDLQFHGTFQAALPDYAGMSLRMSVNYERTKEKTSFYLPASEPLSFQQIHVLVIEKRILRSTNSLSLYIHFSLNRENIFIYHPLMPSSQKLFQCRNQGNISHNASRFLSGQRDSSSGPIYLIPF